MLQNTTHMHMYACMYITYTVKTYSSLHYYFKQCKGNSLTDECGGLVILFSSFLLLDPEDDSFISILSEGAALWVAGFWGSTISWDK